MANEHDEPVIKQGGVLFVCGTVLGVCLGFAAGHLSVWSRVQPAEQDEQWASLDESNQPVRESAAHNPHLIDRPQPFYPESARRLHPPRSREVGRQRQPVRMATEMSATATEPEGLANPSQATPIDEETSYRERVTRSIIAQEMPHASAQELDVWFDVLRGLDPGDVKGILRMRKHVGGGGGKAIAGAPQRIPDPGDWPGSPPSIKQASPTGSPWKSTIDCLAHVRDLRLHNLCNAETAGYQLQVPVLHDVSPHDGALGTRLLRVEHCFAPGEFHKTGRPLDVAIDGHGFLQVKWHDETRLTRNGRLTIDDERHLALATSSKSWRLEPAIVVPEEAGSLTIDADGRVAICSIDSKEETQIGSITLMTVLDPSRLSYDREGLFAVTAASGQPHRLTEGGSLRQFGVERLSQTVIQEQLEALEREDRLVKELQPPPGRASVSDSWP